MLKTKKIQRYLFIVVCGIVAIFVVQNLVVANYKLPSGTERSILPPRFPINLGHLAFPRKDLDKSNFTSKDDYTVFEGPKVNVKEKDQTKLQVLSRPTGKTATNAKTDRLISKLKHLLEQKAGVSIVEWNRIFTKTHKWPVPQPKGRSLPVFRKYKNMTNLLNWEKFHLGITTYSLYYPDAIYVDKMIADIQKQPISSVVMKEGGTQLKLIIKFPDESLAMFKPMRYDRSYQTPPDHFYFSDFERHNAEIAAYHVDRALGFYRSPPVVGRVVNISSELIAKADRAFRNTAFKSPADNICFTGKCSYYCDTGHAFCGRPDMIEGSFAAFLPSLSLAERFVYRHPWRRSYSRKKTAEWETDDTYCDIVRNISLYKDTKRLLDIMDMSVFDFLIGNMDRHHYEVFSGFGNQSFIIHLDHGRAFGRPDADEMSILTPIRQCCVVRQSTVLKLLAFHFGPSSLSQISKALHSADLLYPLLVDSHYTALDRRVAKILLVIANCLSTTQNSSQVIIDDGF